MGWFKWFTSSSKQETAGTQAKEPGAGDTSSIDASISGPFCSGNLAVYLIHSRQGGSSSDFITLEEALAKEKVVVQETGNVSKLQINNLGDEAVFVQSGDIVKGGKQDRAFQYDMILSAKSGFVPINSFCVERSRWHKRGQEDTGHFHASSHNLSSKSLKMAAKYTSNQQEVWDAVNVYQQKSAKNAHVPLSGIQGESASSLELTLEHEKMTECTEKYLEEVSDLPGNQDDVIGYAFAINGHVNSADIYSSNKLFAKMWPKLIRAAAAEAFSEMEEGKSFTPPTSAAVQACIDDAARAEVKELVVSGKSKTFMQESDKNVLFETRDLLNGGKWIHRNYVAK